MMTLRRQPLTLPTTTSSEHFAHMDSSPLPGLVEDVLIRIISLLALDDVQRLRLVNRRLSRLIDSKIVWLNMLNRLSLPLPAQVYPLHDLPQATLKDLAFRAVHLDEEWRSQNPTPSSVQMMSLGSPVTCMAMDSGTLFTAHKDGIIRCWPRLDILHGQSEFGCSGWQEIASRCTSIIPPNRITKFTHLEVCQVGNAGYNLAYVGDSVDRRSYCGVFRVAGYSGTGAKPSIIEPIIHLDNAKGTTSVAISHSKVVLGRGQDSLVIVDLASAVQHTIELASECCGSTRKIIRMTILQDDLLVVASGVSVTVYNLAYNDLARLSTPLFVHALPTCASVWLSNPPPMTTRQATGVLQASKILTALTEDGEVIRYQLQEALNERATVQLTEISRQRFPYPVERLTVTEMSGGWKRAVWVHWRRGHEDWPVELVGSSNNPVQEDGAGAELPTFRILSSRSTPVGSTVTPDVYNFIRKSTSDYGSMPRVCFDEGNGRMVVAGICSPTLAVFDYA
ncbi:hypothetical protein FRC03_001413 [Tulasnella sp. 419]|nr:hypothetical protein FRC02_000728 [Tulasnella sp. 418]KAG8964734.1 hypothetical protein FRC03_001413 [Tulasnella sp. 419]